ncbi:hypothetical protein B0H19DRAFT_101052 [Mycena capillaripes]|nr:hypothetical protein B0H19DRAFT_101052 [Mycena capillaripes]
MLSPVPDSIDPKPSPFVVTHPFAKGAGADAILRSSDGMDFYVHRAILSLVSPVFETMFSLPQAESSPAVPTIDLQEGSATLDRALRFFYPAAQPNVDTLEELQEVIEFLMKYDMQSVVPMVKKHLEKYHSSRPLAVYAIALRHRWKDVAVAAAKESLKHNLRVLLMNAPRSLRESQLWHITIYFSTTLAALKLPDRQRQNSNGFPGPPSSNIAAATRLHLFSPITCPTQCLCGSPSTSRLCAISWQ